MATPPKLPAGFKGPWKRAPKLNAGIWQVGKVGKGPLRGQFVAKRMPGATKPKPDPYAGHPDAPLLRQFEGQDWAQNIIRQMRREQTHHEQWVGNTVMPWQSGALTRLANINKAAQDQFTGQQQAAAQGMAQAGGATPGMVQGVSGGAVAGPNAFQQAATAQAMATQASTMGQVAQWQGLMGTLGPTTFSQGQVAALSDYAKGLPVLYAQKRQERVDAMNQYIAEQEQAQAEHALEMAKFEEQQRRNRVDESIRATNAQSNAAIAFANLGLDAAAAAGDQPLAAPGALPPGFVAVPSDDGGFDIEQDPSYVPPGQGGPAPEGFVQLPDGRYARDPTYVNPNAGSSGSGGDIKPPYAGWVGGWTKPPSTKQREAWKKQGRAAPVKVKGRWWVGPRPSGGTARNQGTLTNELTSLFRGTADRDGWEELGPTKARNEVSLWVRKNKPSFAGPRRKVNEPLLASVLRSVIQGPRGGLADQVAKHLQTHYMVKRDDGWYWK